MRNLREVYQYRVFHPQVYELFNDAGEQVSGIFLLPSPTDRRELKVIASCTDGWDHVSVSRETRCPNWPEMSFVWSKFFKDNEAAYQLHVPVNEHINYHPYCLHIWRPWNGEVQMPPSWMVGPKKAENA